jgi:dTDP-4-dehydrorhamnose 3,5-epimerase-like enzyme
MSLSQCKIIHLPTVVDRKGNLIFAESERQIPFAVKRIYFLHNVPEAGMRGGHAHKALHQLMIAANGSFDVLLDDGLDKQTFHLHTPSQGLYICPMMWRELRAFSADSVCLVLASDYYDEKDYIRDCLAFCEATKRLV